MHKKDLGDRLEQVRNHFDLSQTKFSSAIGMSQGNYSKIEAGEVKASDTLILAIMNRFAVNPDWIKTGEGEMLIAPEEYIANGIKILGAQRFCEGLSKVLKDPQFAELQALMALGELVKGSLDGEFEPYLRYIVDTWRNGDEKMRNWLVVQLEKAFGEVKE